MTTQNTTETAPAGQNSGKRTFRDLAIGDVFRWSSNLGGQDELMKMGEDEIRNMTTRGIVRPLSCSIFVQEDHVIQLS